MRLDGIDRRSRGKLPAVASQRKGLSEGTKEEVAGAQT